MTTDPSLQKADFGAIYDQPDPRPYFTTLEPYDYVIPQHGADVYAQLLKLLTTGAEQPPKVLDVCCSYGVVPMLLKTALDMRELYKHYGDPATAALSTEEVAEVDRRLLLEHLQPGAPYVIGLDVAKNAVDYAVATGSLDAGATENLETDDPSGRLATLLSEVDLITTTGGVGYVTDLTFDRLLKAAPDSVWVAAFCLRTYDYGPIAEALGARGLRTERAARTFPQRRFTGPEEKRWAVSEARSRGYDPADKEAGGYYHAGFYLSRPAEEVSRRPLEQLLPGLC